MIRESGRSGESSEETVGFLGIGIFEKDAGRYIWAVVKSPIRACFGKRRGPGSQQVAENHELWTTFLKIPDYQGFQEKMACF